jgi:dipeptidyl-peptidase-4
MRKILPLLWLLLACTWAYAQGFKEITLEDIYEKGTFVQKSVQGIYWMKNGSTYTVKEGNNVVLYDMPTGFRIRTIFNGDSAKVNFSDYEFSANERKILLTTNDEKIYRHSFKADYLVFDLDISQVIKVSNKGKQQVAKLSPDGSKVAFVRDNNLFYTDLNTFEEFQLTKDGAFNKIINGHTDWVYEEEFSFTRAFEWSVDSQKIAFIRFDESNVKEFAMQMWGGGSLYQKYYTYKYPKAGEENAKVSVFIQHLDSVKTLVQVNTDINDQYIPQIKWSLNPDILAIKKLNRLQNRMELLHVSASTGDATPIYTEESSTYVDVGFCNELEYYPATKENPSGFFLISSEKDGYKHLYLYNMNGSLNMQLTSGSWEVDSFLGLQLDTKKQITKVFYTSSEAAPTERHFYSVEYAKGKINKQRLTNGAGINTVNMSPTLNYFINTFTSAETPNLVQAHGIDKKGNWVQLRTLEDNAALRQKYKEYGFAKKEFFDMPTRDGNYMLSGYYLKPANFDPKKKYPALIFQYSGPGSQNVLNGWGGSNYYWHQMLAQKGYLVAVIDTRGTGGRGRIFKHLTYGQMGKLESEDLVDCGKFIGRSSFVDPTRVGIWGWSYGGYMSSLALFIGNDVFKMGIAVAPVTTWRFYDTIYTERFLKRPQDNPKGYDEFSPIMHADKLKGNYLLIHGTGDDNVHFQNAITLQDVLIKAGKQFDTFYYPDRDHGIYGGNTRMHLFKMMTNYVMNKL